MAPKPTIENVEVARLLREIADLLEIQAENPFRIRAYRNAARTVEELAEPVADLTRDGIERLDELPGIGEDLAGKIQEIVRTGTFQALTELRGKVAPGTADLMRLPGIGPKKAKLLAERLGVHDLGALLEAAEAGQICELPGFGKRTEERILQELRGRRAAEHRVLRSTAAQYGETLVEHLRALPSVGQVEIAGSFRRARETVGDLDLLATAARGGPVVDAFVTHPEVEEVLARGSTKASVRLKCGLQVDLRVVGESSYGAALHYFTGSKPHNIAVRRLGQERGLKINEYGVHRGKRRIAGRTEEEVYRAVDLPWIPPELREDRGELEAARAGRFPDLVELGDIRGDLQMHTKDSDGRATLEEMVRAAVALGYEYVAITDHSPAVRIARGMDAAGFRRQAKRIDALNRRLDGITVLRGAEVDILRDGTLDLPDRLLDGLDIVVAAVHSNMKLPAREQTRRVVKAIQHRAVDVIAHPTGRIIGRRDPMPIDMRQVVRAARDHGVMLEINAQPERLDIDDLTARPALEAGVTLAVSTDAHSTAELRYMRWGIDQARRAWATPAHVANTRTLDELLPLLRRARQGGTHG